MGNGVRAGEGPRQAHLGTPTERGEYFPRSPLFQPVLLMLLGTSHLCLCSRHRHKVSAHAPDDIFVGGAHAPNIAYHKATHCFPEAHTHEGTCERIGLGGNGYKKAETTPKQIMRRARAPLI